MISLFLFVNQIPPFSFALFTFHCGSFPLSADSETINFGAGKLTEEDVWLESPTKPWHCFLSSPPLLCGGSNKFRNCFNAALLFSRSRRKGPKLVSDEAHLDGALSVGLSIKDNHPLQQQTISRLHFPALKPHLFAQDVDLFCIVSSCVVAEFFKKNWHSSSDVGFEVFFSFWAVSLMGN